jgi:hypothetical protein
MDVAVGEMVRRDRARQRPRSICPAVHGARVDRRDDGGFRRTEATNFLRFGR